MYYINQDRVSDQAFQGVRALMGLSEPGHIDLGHIGNMISFDHSCPECGSPIFVRFNQGPDSHKDKIPEVTRSCPEACKFYEEVSL
jgi:hypothetical protein